MASLANSDLVGYAKPWNFGLVLAARAAKNFPTVTTVMLSLVNGKLHSAVGASYHTLILDPMVYHALK